MFTEGSDVCKAFVKALALAKVGYSCAHKLYGQAQKRNDAHTIAFLECCIFEAVSPLCCFVSFLNMHTVQQQDMWPVCFALCLQLNLHD